MARKRKLPDPVYVVLASPAYETSKPFAVISGKDAEAWAKRLADKIRACDTHEAVKQLAEKWYNHAFTHLGQVEEVAVYPVIMNKYEITVAEMEAEGIIGL